MTDAATSSALGSYSRLIQAKPRTVVGEGEVAVRIGGDQPFRGGVTRLGGIKAANVGERLARGKFVREPSGRSRYCVPDAAEPFDCRDRITPAESFGLENDRFVANVLGPILAAI